MDKVFPHQAAAAGTTGTGNAGGAAMSERIPPTIRFDIAGAADNVLANSRDRMLVITPLLFQPSDGLAGRVWYFTVCSCAKRRGFTASSRLSVTKPTASP
jgi:hypothetical protein